MVAMRTGWRVGEVFSFNGGWEDCLHLDPPIQAFSPKNLDLRRLLHTAILDNDGRLTFDLPGLCAWAMSRKEEGGAGSWSVRGRFPIEESRAAKDKVVQRPYLDLLIERFCDEVVRLRFCSGHRTPEVKRPWPGSKQAAVCITHDVDLIDGSTALWARRAFWQVKRIQNRLSGKSRAAMELTDRLARWKEGGDDPVWSVPKWLEEEWRYGIRSTFYFMSLASNLSFEGRRYHFRHPRLVKATRMLREAGFEIGLHAASRDAGSLKYLISQQARLEETAQAPISSVRHHYLNTRFPDSWNLMDRAGFATSSNIAWGGHDNGFRAGTCWPYRPGEIPGIETGGRLIEVPFQLMDRSCIKDVDGFVAMATRMLAEAKKAGGVFVVNFHADYWDEIEAPGVHRAYTRLIRTIIGDSDLWVAPVGEVAKRFAQAYDRAPDQPGYPVHDDLPSQVSHPAGF
jgi:hypothetical protein